MADDLYGMLFGSLTPEKKLLTAITNGMDDTVLVLLSQGGYDLANATLQTENGRKALHIVCLEGKHQMISCLVRAGAIIGALDMFGFTPLELAVRKNNAGCVHEIFIHDSRQSGVSLERIESPSIYEPTSQWGCYRITDPALLEIRIIATPEMSGQFISAASRYLTPESYTRVFRVFLIAGNLLQSDLISKILSGPTDMIEVFKEWQHVQSLQHYARISIRRTLTTNVYYGARQLPIPVTLQQYLTISELGA